MRRKLSFLLAVVMACALIPFGLEKSALAIDYSMVRVQLSVGTGVQSFPMTLSGSYFIKENGVSLKNGSLTAQLSGGRIVLMHSSAGEVFSGSSVTISRERWDPSTGYIRATVGGVTRSYLGNFTIKAGSSGLRVINTLPLPHYLYGVVRGEMNNEFPIEALKAQAIAAKCYVLANMTGGSDYDIGDTASDQVYKGYIASETSVMAAVNATYDIGLYLGTSILSAYYAASNGGYTILPSDVWTGTNRYLWDKAYVRTQDPYDVANPESVQETAYVPMQGDSSRNMTPTMSAYLKGLSALALREQRQINAGDQVTAINQVLNFRALYDANYSVNSSNSPNVEISMVVTVNGAQQLQFTYQFDIKQFTWNGIWTHAMSKSMRLVAITQSQDNFVVYHGRYGHGVGMSQRGAQQMANQRMTYQQILQFYYPGASIRSMGIALPADPINPGGSSTNPGTSDPGASLGAITATAVTTSSTTLRQGPSTGTAGLATVARGTTLNIYGEQQGFSYVEYRGKVGYVANTYLTITPVGGPSNGSSGSAPISSGAKGTIIASRAMLRAKASSSGTIVAALLPGVVVDINSESGDYYGVQIKGYSGYVLKSEINITDAGNGSSGGGSNSSSGNSSNSSDAVIGYGETTGSVNFRKGPGSNNEKIKMLDKGTKLTIYSKSNGWYYVEANGTKGYVSATYVKETGSSGSSGSSSNSSSGSSDAIIGYGETTGSVNFRKGPSSNHEKIKMLDKGTKLTIYSKSNGWYYVEANGTKGYVSATYVKETGSGNSSGTSSANTASGTRSWSAKVINEWVWLRSSPAAKDNSNVIQQCPVGTLLTVYGQTDSFYQVSVDGVSGYMHKDYVQVLNENTSGSSSPSSGATSSSSGVTTTEVRLRSTATTSTSSNVIATLKKGTSLVIHGSNGFGWYEVTADGKRGFISASYVRLT